MRVRILPGAQYFISIDFLFKKGYTQPIKQPFYMLKLKSKKLLFALSLFFLFLIVSPVLGDGLVPCSGFDCTFDDLRGMIGGVVNFVLFQIVPVLAIIGFLVSGIIMITSGGDPGKFNQGKTAMIAIAVGLMIAYLAWAIVKLFIDVIGGAEWTKLFFQ